MYCILPLGQNYEDEDLPGVQLQDEMNTYLADVIEDKGVKDLRDTREQVRGPRRGTSSPGVFGFDVVGLSRPATSTWC